MVAVIRVGNIMEPITRAKTHLSVILVDDAAKEYFQKDLGLVEKVQLSGESAEISQKANDEADADEGEEEIEDEVEEKISCMSGSSIS